MAKRGLSAVASLTPASLRSLLSFRKTFNAISFIARSATSKLRPSKLGRFGAGGQRFSRGALYLMLKNRIYRGEIVQKGKAFPGEHAAIVDQDLWRRVQSHLEENRIERGEGDKALEPSLLAGIVFDAASMSEPSKRV